jgi:hypothetical protein
MDYFGSGVTRAACMAAITGKGFFLYVNLIFILFKLINIIIKGES